MDALDFNQLEEQYRKLSKRYQQQEISHDQFIQEAQQLRLMDNQGIWWTIQPETGKFLKYQDGSWQTAQPPHQAKVTRPPAQRGSPPPKTANKSSGCLTSPLAVGLMSFGSAGFWLIYSNIRAGQEIFDLITPLIMGGVPFLLRLYQKKIDEFLQPVYQVTTQFPFAMRTGAAFALPVVLGLVTSTMNGAGYGALRFTTLASILGGYVLTRKVS